jgi:adenosylmethionine-8-amino-7-oxononanoate aminotransferase
MSFDTSPSTPSDNRRNYFWHPMGHPADATAKPQRTMVRGEGIYLTDSSGKRFLDATSGQLGNVTLGYSVVEIKRAIAAQLDALPYYAAFGGSTNRPAEELSRILIEDWFGRDGMARVFFCSGGSDAVETALRLSRQYWKIQGERDRYKFIALRNGYHGTHFGGASLNSKPAIRRNYEPLLGGVFHIPTPWTYLNPFDETDPERLGELCARALEEEIRFQGPDTVAAFIAEPVTSAGGLVVPPPNFWTRIREICNRYDVLLIADEVITGFGRTGFESGSRGWAVKPDMMTTAKAITSGYFPLGATLIGEKVAQVFEANRAGFGMIGHGYTYSGHPVGCAAAIAALGVARERRVWENAAARGVELMAGLQRLHQKHAVVGEVRGRGLMACLELVADRKSKTPIDSATIARISEAILARGVMVRASESSIGLAPPLIIEPADIEQIIDVVDQGLAAAA